MRLPDFDNKADLFEYLHRNKKLLIAEKRATMKKAPAFAAAIIHQKAYADAAKESDEHSAKESDELRVKAIINTTNFMDSHDDVHMPGIWNKGLRENKNILMLQEHEMRFESIIADGNDLRPSVKQYSWADLGYNYVGTTEALVFDSLVKRKRNEFMYYQYKNGFVKNHSVGMIYVKIELAMNDERYEKEFQLWNSKINTIANKSQAELKGYFWCVYEAKIVEGSAVVIGSNTVTPTMSTSEIKSIDNRLSELENKIIEYIEAQQQEIKPVITQEAEPKKDTTFTELMQQIQSIN